jgi:hypothetical protein
MEFLQKLSLMGSDETYGRLQNRNPRVMLAFFSRF